AAYGVHGVERETDDVADMRGDFRIAVGLNELAVFADLILFLSGGGQISGIHALHTDEDVDATGLTGLGDKVFDLPGEDVNLHHESHGDFFVGAQTNQGVEDSFPVFVAGKIVQPSAHWPSTRPGSNPVWPLPKRCTRDFLHTSCRAIPVSTASRFPSQ